MSIADVMTAKAQPSDTETRFREIYEDELNSTQQTRLTLAESERSRKTEDVDNEGWSVMQRKAKKVRFTKHTKSLKF